MTKQEQQDQLKQESEKYINEIKTKIEMENNMRDLKLLTLSANVERCLREQQKDFCMDCPKYKECKLSKDLCNEQQKKL